MNSEQMCIDDSRHLSPGVRVLEALVTVLLWLAYLGLLSRVQSSVMNHVGQIDAPRDPFEWSWSQASGLGFDSFVTHLLIITFCGSSLLFLWAWYNRRRFRGWDRRQNPVVLSEKQLAEYFGATSEEIEILQHARRLVMHHDADGRLKRVRYRPSPIADCGPLAQCKPPLPHKPGCKQRRTPDRPSQRSATTPQVRRSHGDDEIAQDPAALASA